MSRTYNVISADGHLEFPPDRLIPFVPEQYRDRAPRLVKVAGGGEAMLLEGWPLLPNHSNILRNKKLNEPGLSYWEPDGSPSPGTGEAPQRLKEQDDDGLDAEVLFPAVFYAVAIQKIEDKDVYRALIRAYNTYLASEYCVVAPDRLIATGALPITGVDDAIEEMRWCKEAGLKAVNLHEFPNGGHTPADEDDKFWETALNMGMPITAHTHFGYRYPTQFIMSPPPPEGPPGERLIVRQAFTPPMMTVAQLIYHGVFDRFPELRLYFAETQASWLACALYQMDENAELYAHLLNWDGKPPPSEYIKKHVHFGIVRDPVATHMADSIPVDKLMWGSDFPHGIGCWPESNQWLERTFGDVSPEIKRKVLLENPAGYFGLDLEAPITPTPA